MKAASHEKRCSWLAKCLIRFQRLEKFAFAGINPGDIKKREDAFLRHAVSLHGSALCGRVEIRNQCQ